MARVIVSMTTSIDGFVADQGGSADRLYPDLGALRGGELMSSLIERAGAVLMGRRTSEMGDPDWYVGNYEYQLPIFGLTHRPPAVPPKQDEHLAFTFVTDGVASAVEQATAAAGDKAVQVVGGVDLAPTAPGRRSGRRAQRRRHAGVPGYGPPPLRGPRARAGPTREDRRARGGRQDQHQLPPRRLPRSLLG